MEDSKIGWTDHTWNPWWGCNKVSEACTYCYIDAIMRRSGRKPFGGPIRTSHATWRKPYAWDRRAAKDRRRRRIFTCSMSDFFHPGADDWRDEAWDVIRACQNLDWLILTKRPELIEERLPSDWGNGFANVWLGVTVELQRHIRRLDTLAKIPAAIRFVSAEPLLGRLKFGRRIGKLDWVITGCERAHKEKRRPMALPWVLSIRRECESAGVPLFHKQYYLGSKLTYDGLIDGQCCQQWPASAA